MKDTIIPVGIDVGNSTTEIAIWTNNEQGERSIKCFKFQSDIKKGAPSLSVDFGTSREMGFKIDDSVFYTVEENCENSINLFELAQDSDARCVLAYAAMQLAGLAGKKVVVATNLPLKHESSDLSYFSLNPKTSAFEKNSELIQKKAKKLEKIDIKTVGSDKEITKVSGATCFAEMFAAHINLVCDNYGGENQELKDKTIGYIDIGGGTTDIGIVKKGFQLAPETAITIPKGVLSIHQILYTKIIKKHPDLIEGFDLTKHRTLLTRIINERKIVRGSKSYDVKALVDESIKEVAEDIIFQAKNKLFNNSAIIDEIKYVGGGAYIFKEYLDTVFNKKTTPSNDLEFENAKGLLKVITFLGGLNDKINVDNAIKELEENILEEVE